jgi:hypothetical protein
MGEMKPFRGIYHPQPLRYLPPSHGITHPLRVRADWAVP